MKILFRKQKNMFYNVSNLLENKVFFLFSLPLFKNIKDEIITLISVSIEYVIRIITINKKFNRDCLNGHRLIL